VTAIRATVRQRRQDFAAGIELARRSLPEDPQQRAAMTAQRIAAITGCQHTEVVCWRCHADVDISEARPDGGQDFTCTDFGACDERAAMQADEERNERVFGGAHA
jgi:hypothetical protein